MRVQMRHNLNRSELTLALSGLIKREDIGEDILLHLSKDDHEEPVPEKYIRYIVSKISKAFKSLIDRLCRNIEKWLSFMFGKKGEPPALLTKEQLDELRLLIESHFRQFIGIELKLPKGIENRWYKMMAIEKPDDSMEKWLMDSYIAGRVSSVTDNNSSYERMISVARKAPFSRLDELVIEASKQNAAKYVSGYGRKLADVAEEVLVQNHKSALQSIIQGYFTGDLKHTTYNGEGFTPAEVNKLSTVKEVRNWRELSTELKNRFKAADVGRDWDRIAVSEVRFATNMGRLMNIQIEGGGDPADIEVYYHVQKTACKYCKKLYLNEDGSPKIFKLSEIMKNVQETGGMQIGLRAGLIGESGGWVPNTLCHPFGHCYPVRVIKGYNIIPMGGTEDDRKET